MQRDETKCNWSTETKCNWSCLETPAVCRPKHVCCSWHPQPFSHNSTGHDILGRSDATYDLNPRIRFLLPGHLGFVVCNMAGVVTSSRSGEVINTFAHILLSRDHMYIYNDPM
jgi:hypothetical protein